jgi:hypothetical protein
VESMYSGFTGSFSNWECLYLCFFKNNGSSIFFLCSLSTSYSIKSDFGVLGRERVPTFHQIIGSMACSQGIPKRIWSCRLRRVMLNLPIMVQSSIFTVNMQ